MIKNGLKSIKKATARTSSTNKYFDLFKGHYPIEKRLANNVEYFEKYSKHRSIYRIYDIWPIIDYNTFIAPNCTIVGEVFISNSSQIGYNTVIRGDINSVRIGSVTTIGDHVVIHTANSLPTGLPASVEIGPHNIIQNRVSLYSCHTEKTVFIGHGSVILEGSRIEQGAVILPNSVVPPGRIIPAHQVWGGNPVEYVRDLRPGEVFSNYANAYSLWEVAKSHKETFTPTNLSYLKREVFREDLDLAPEEMTMIIENSSEYLTNGLRLNI
jgi:gamma-carbonic anhydrase